MLSIQNAARMRFRHSFRYAVQLGGLARRDEGRWRIVRAGAG
jgi:hypothetical protein